MDGIKHMSPLKFSISARPFILMILFILSEFSLFLFASPPLWFIFLGDHTVTRSIICWVKSQRLSERNAVAVPRKLA